MLRYAITDRYLLPTKNHGSPRALTRQDTPPGRATFTDQEALVTHVRHLARSGVDVIQLREKDLPGRDLESLTRSVVEAVSTASPDPDRPAVLLNGPAHLAAANGASGVHLRGGAGERDLARVHEVFAVAGLRAPAVSVSCHSVAEVDAAASAGFDYLLFGPIFEKRVRGELVAGGLGLDQLRQAAGIARSSKLLALGGVTLGNTALCLQAGAAGIAGIRLFL